MHGLSTHYAARGDERALGCALRAVVADATAAELYLWAAELLRRAERPADAARLEREAHAIARGGLTGGSVEARF